MSVKSVTNKKSSQPTVNKEKSDFNEHTVKTYNYVVSSKYEVLTSVQNEKKHCNILTDDLSKMS